jgi:hypothetical protein
MHYADLPGIDHPYPRHVGFRSFQTFKQDFGPILRVAKVDLAKSHRSSANRMTRNLMECASAVVQMGARETAL